ncbi:hypothetical protein R69776_07879 [Paraburkholderia nemoris]|uniref:AcrB/AcrD/AcrF family protein n=1 Tax=Paraburkholderia nemoris TaxID=2793076 RepID=A0ABM8T5N1_9BURK|nr:hypothetical protein R75777_07200 [Paraburkholderia nemoris]CAE6858583.1 hypothetical protein R69776_07879 [Paraburkholderia nemoris]
MQAAPAAPATVKILVYSLSAIRVVWPAMPIRRSLRRRNTKRTTEGCGSWLTQTAVNLSLLRQDFCQPVAGICANARSALRDKGFAEQIVSPPKAGAAGCRTAERQVSVRPLSGVRSKTMTVRSKSGSASAMAHRASALRPSLRCVALRCVALRCVAGQRATCRRERTIFGLDPLDLALRSKITPSGARRVQSVMKNSTRFVTAILAVLTVIALLFIPLPQRIGFDTRIVTVASI